MLRAIVRSYNSMGALYGIYSWGLFLQALAIFHFIRRRPDTYWIFIILFGGGIGALVYLLVEALPDAGLLRDSFKGFSRRGRIRQLEATILDNPSAGNLEELADLYLEEKRFARARDYYNRAISSRTDSPDPFYRRAICSVEAGDFAAAVPDLERVVRQDAKYDYHRAAGLLAHAYAQTGQTDRAAALFQQVTAISTLSETQFNYASFLASQGHSAEARDWVQRILNKKPTMPRYLKRRERPWFRRAAGLLRRLPA
ncbi:MAG TPA: tetratricopeptide repeat protein [Terriglobales bacterium]|nr:tetratricopeptide repeat protein [Terriglobales bacterium]